MPKISVITPVYNSEKYLEECLCSLISQTFRDIEFILIDDGSTDSSPQICDKYAELDSRIKVIHKENAGMGVSYNLGMDLASGEYIGFLESDDFADKHMFENLFYLATKYNTDIVKSAWFRYFTTDHHSEKDFRLAGYNSYQVIKTRDFPELLLKQPTVWSAIYKTEFIRNNNVRYLETPGASYQDVAFTFKAFCKAQNMVITPDAYVYYRQDNENSSINSKDKAEAIFWEYAEVDKFFDENPEIKVWANTYKLIKQYLDYDWNYSRIADDLKPNFIKRYGKDFQKYKKQGELNYEFYKNIDKTSFALIMNATV